MHNGGVRASSRLVLVWTSISLVVVAVAWAALGSAIQTGSPDPTEVAALDPSMLRPAPTPTAKATTTPKALPSPTPSKAAQAVNRADRGAQGRQATTPPPSRRTPTPRPSASTSSPIEEPAGSYPQVPNRQDTPMEVVRELNSIGGIATVGFADGLVYLLEYHESKGYAPELTQAATSVVMRFTSQHHVSTIRAYVDSAAGTYHATIVEEDR